jgi:hypothetical protein
MCLPIIEGIGHEATTAAAVSIGATAVEDLLLWELWKDSLLYFVHGLKRTHWGEWIATSALSLITDSVKHSLLPPIEWGRLALKASSSIIHVIFKCDLIIIISSFIIDSERLESLHLFEFFKGEISELVHSDVITSCLGIMCFDQGEVGCEDAESCIILLLSNVVSAVLGYEALEGL